jgi:hypothetical protein
MENGSVWELPKRLRCENIGQTILEDQEVLRKNRAIKRLREEVVARESNHLLQSPRNNTNNSSSRFITQPISVANRTGAVILMILEPPDKGSFNTRSNGT